MPVPQSRVALLAPVMTATAALAALLLLGQTGYLPSAGYRIRSLERIRTAQHSAVQQLDAEVA